MSESRFRTLGMAATITATITATSVLAVSPLLSSTVGSERHPARAVTEIALLTGQGWIMSGTGQPDPSVGPYLDQVAALYLDPASPLFPGQQTFPGYVLDGLTTPEQFCPFVCLPGEPPLNFADSLSQGVDLLNGRIVPALQNGDNVVMFGYSQSATIASLAMNNLIAGPPAGLTPTHLSNLQAVLIGDPNSPTGGILDRFQFPDGIQDFSLASAAQHIPFVNIPLSMLPTPTTMIPSDTYIGEYDGWANFPQDQLNILAIVNALIGIATVHPFYSGYTVDQLASVIDVGSIGAANFYYIPQNLPILQFMYNGGTAGQFFGDALSPWLRLLIDWGYGNAGDPAVNGLHPVPDGAFIEGSPYQQAFGVAGGPWAATPHGELYQDSAFADAADSGIAGLFQKMDPLQMLAGVQYAALQSLIGPWADVAAAATGGTLTPDAIGTIDGLTTALQLVTGYDLVNAFDQALITGWDSLVNPMGLGDVLGPDAILTGPLLPGGPLIDLVSVGFNLFNFFGA